MNVDYHDIYQVKEYKIISQETIAELNSEGFVLQHIKTGAKLVLLANDDNNKVFDITFRTPPMDSTGAPHILEHSVLCGSEKFPLKDPFIELAKGSLNTFLNAITYPDKTMYPVASCNAKDFFNLVDVYMDAVFHPNIYKHSEIFRQEGWNYNLENENDEIKINGVVYNEMKGAYSDPEEILDRFITSTLFPDTQYANESGGDPLYIPDLTYDRFLEFHKKYYHPSNSYIYLYGDMNMAEYLKWIDEEYLSTFDDYEVESKIQEQKPFEKMKTEVIDYSVTVNESIKDNTFLSYSSVIDNYLDTNMYIAFQIIEYSLMNMPGAPVKMALIDAGIGKDVYGDYSYGARYPYFTFTAKNANEDQKNEFLTIIKRELEKIVRNGFDKKSLLAGLNSIEFKTRENDFGDFPKGLLFGISIFHTWLYDDEHPFNHVKTDEAFKFLREQIDTDYFEKLVEKYLLDNNHSALVIARPKVDLNLENEEKLADRLRMMKKAMSADEIHKMVEDTKKLKKYQEEPTPDEDLERIPVLDIQDIGTEPEPLDMKVDNSREYTVIHDDYFTNRIGYLVIGFNSNELPLELLPYLGLYKIVFGMMDTKNYSYQDLSNECSINVGGMNFSTAVYSDYDNPKTIKLISEIRAKVMYDKIEYPFLLAKEIIRNTKYDNKKRLKEIIDEAKSRLSIALINQGNSTAVTRALSYYSKSAYINESLRGISFYEFLQNIDENFDTMYDEIIRELDRVGKYVFRKENMVINYAATDDGFKIMESCLDGFADSLFDEKIPEFDKVLGLDEIIPRKKNEGFKTSSQVQYVACAGNFIDGGFKYSGSLKVLRIIMSYDYLWNNVRVKGGAYGCGFNSLRNGNCYFSSYRDPNLSTTLDVYRKVPEYIRLFQADERELKKYIIGTVSDMDTPLTNSQRASRLYAAYMTNVPYEALKKERMEVLKTTSEDIRALANAVEYAISQNNICVIGSENGIEKDKVMFENINNLQS